MATPLPVIDEASAGCSMVCPRRPPWRRFVDWLIPERFDESFYEYEVPRGGDVVSTWVTVHLDWPGWVRLALLGRRLKVDVRVLTTEPVNTISSRSRVSIG